MKQSNVRTPGRMTRALSLLLAIAGIAAPAPHSAFAGGTIRAVATTGMVADLVRQVGGNRVEVFQLMGAGVDPHLYKPTFADTVKLQSASAIFYNGLYLEGRMGEIFERLAGNGKQVYALAADIPKDRLIAPEGFVGHPDPHIWFDVALWAEGVPVIVRGLSAADPAGATEFEARGAELIGRLKALDAWCREMAASIPEEHRLLVTSHDAFGYFGRAYGFTVLGLQGVSTVSEAALADVVSLVDYLKQKRVRAIFVETSVNPAAIERVAKDAGVRIGGELFSDAMGAPGEIRKGFDTGTYEGMIRYNLSTIIEALK